MMNKLISGYIITPLITITVLSSLLGFALGCSQNKDQGITFQHLFSNPSQYDGKEITLEGFYFQGFEVQVIAERLDYSGYAEGHLIPQGGMVWVEGGISKEVYDELNQQQQMGPLERLGKVRITGKFEYGGEYGHLGEYDKRITPTATTILPWTPPAPATSGEGFAIFLTKDDIPPSNMEALSHVDIAQQPIISITDIITYNAQTYEITLNENAFRRTSTYPKPTIYRMTFSQ